METPIHMVPFWRMMMTRFVVDLAPVDPLRGYLRAKKIKVATLEGADAHAP